LCARTTKTIFTYLSIIICYDACGLATLCYSIKLIIRFLYLENRRSQIDNATLNMVSCYVINQLLVFKSRCLVFPRGLKIETFSCISPLLEGSPKTSHCPPLSRYTPKTHQNTSILILPSFRLTKLSKNVQIQSFPLIKLPSDSCADSDALDLVQ